VRINVSVGRTDAAGINSFISLKKINAYKIYHAAEATPLREIPHHSLIPFTDNLIPRAKRKYNYDKQY